MNDIMLIIKEISERTPQIIAQMISNIKTPPKPFFKQAAGAFTLSCLPCNSWQNELNAVLPKQYSSCHYKKNPKPA